MPSSEEYGRDPVEPSCSPDELVKMHTDRGSVGEPGLTLSASSVHNGVNTQKIGSNRDLSLLWPNGWMDEDAAWYTEVDLGPGHIVLYGVPAPAKGAQQPPSFRPMSIVATVAHLSYC